MPTSRKHQFNATSLLVSSHDSDPKLAMAKAVARSNFNFRLVCIFRLMQMIPISVAEFLAISGLLLITHIDLPYVFMVETRYTNFSHMFHS